MKRNLAIVLLIAAFGCIAACRSNAQEKPCEVSTDKIENVDKENIVLLDVRTPGEFESGHLAGAKLVDVNGADFSREIEKLDKDKQYYVYCRSGKRSARARDIMLEKGFKNVCNVEGGVLKMQSEGMKLVKE